MMIIGLFGVPGLEYQFWKHTKKNIFSMVILIELFHLLGDDDDHILVMSLLWP